MERIGGYAAQAKNWYDSAVQKDRKEAEKAGTAARAEDKKNEPARLSAGAKRLLQQLQKAYGNMDIMVADYETDEEAAAYLSRGTKEYSVLINPDELEKMAADGVTKDKYMGILDDAASKLDDMRSRLGDQEQGVTHLGFSVGKGGTVSYFADLEQLSEKQRERIERSRTESREDRDARPGKRTRVSAGSVEELLEKIRSVDWDRIKEERAATGSRFDYSI